MIDQTNIDSIFKRSTRKIKPLFIFEMANNHMGDVDHGLKIIREFHKIRKGFNFNFAIKFQYRYLDTFVHPDFVNRKDIKLIKRFKETILNEKQYKILKDETEKLGFISICTPFDEKAVALIVKHNYDILKIPSCYFNDWPLLEKIATTNKPIIASTAGAKLEDIDKVVSFFVHRNRKFALLHCVGEYPTLNKDLQLNQIDLLINRYNVPIGFSTHESPDNLDSIKIAISKGARIFEKHVGVKTEKYDINAYSATPEAARKWLESAKLALLISDEVNGRHKQTPREAADLRALHRGAYAKKKISSGERLDVSNVFFAMPNEEGQLVANEFTKYTDFILKKTISTNAPIMLKNLIVVNKRNQVAEIVNRVKKILHEAKIILPNKVEIEISHHYGMKSFYKWGAVIINVVNRQYCKKLIILLPEQKYPEHCHKKKDETMHILYGEMSLCINREQRKLKTGDIATIERKVKHAFMADKGVIFEEISTKYYKGDSYWEDKKIFENKNRKTYLTYWFEDFNRPGLLK